MTARQRELIASNRGLAEHISHDYLVNAPGLDIEEVVSVAYQGLLDAALAFDESKGVPFGAYARRRIKGAIIDWQRSEDYLQRLVRADLKTLISKGYRPGSSYDIEALSSSTGLSHKRIRAVILAAAADPTSTDAMPDAEATIQDRSVDVEASVRVAAIQGSVAAVVQRLPTIQQVVLALHYFEGIELRQVAERLGVSPAHVRQAHVDAVLAVHQEMARQAREGQ